MTDPVEARPDDLAEASRVGVALGRDEQHAGAGSDLERLADVVVSLVHRDTPEEAHPPAAQLFRPGAPGRTGPGALYTVSKERLSSSLFMKTGTTRPISCSVSRLERYSLLSLFLMLDWPQKVFLL